MSHPEADCDYTYNRPVILDKLIHFSVPYNAENIRVSVTTGTPSIQSINGSAYLINKDENAACEPYVDFSSTPDAQDLYPQNLVELGGGGYHFGINKIVSVDIRPLQVCIQNDKLYFYEDISVSLTWDLQDNPNKEFPKRLSPSYIKNGIDVVKSYVVNPEDVEENMYSCPTPLTIDNEQYEYIIICPDRLAQSLNRLAAIRRTKGYSSRVFPFSQVFSNPVCKDGDKTSNIADSAGVLREFIKFCYNNYGTEHVLLAGKYPEMPIRYGSRRNYNNELEEYEYELSPSDIYFSDLDTKWIACGEQLDNGIRSEYDYFGEIMIGRIPFSNSDEVDNYVSKIKYHEFNPGNGDSDYLNRAIFTRQKSLSSYVDSDLNAFYSIYKDNLCRLDDYKNPIKGAEVVNTMNSTKFGTLNFVGHGNPGGVGVSDPLNGLVALDDNDSFLTPERGNGLDNLSLEKYTNWCYSCSCTLMPYDIFTEKKWKDGKYNYYTYNVKLNFGESYLLNKKTGGVALIGNTRDSYVVDGRQLISAFYTDLESAYQSCSAYKYGVLAGSIFNYSRALFSSRAYDEKFMHNLFGDPLIPLWIKAPHKILYNEYRNKDFGGYSCDVTTEGEDNLILAITSLYDDTYARNQELETTQEITVPENTVYTIYGKNTLPCILPLRIQNITLWCGKEYYIYGNEVWCGKMVNPDAPNIEVTIQNDAALTIEAMSDVHITNGTIFSDNSTLNIISSGNVYLTDIQIPATAHLNVKAKNIYYKDLIFPDWSTLKLEAEEDVINLEKFYAKGRKTNDEGMLTPGRTWWYNSPVTGNWGQYEFGVRIGDEIEIEGHTWKKIEVIKQAFNGVYFGCDDWELHDDIQDTGYIRLDEDSNVIVRFTKRNYAEGESRSDVIIALARENILEGRNMMGLTFDIAGGDEIVVYSLDESKTNFTFGMPNVERPYDETALDFTIKSVGAFDGGVIPETQLFTCEQSVADTRGVKFEYNYTDQFGVVSDVHGYGLFFFPYPDMCPSLPITLPPVLRYVTDKDNNILYEAEGGLKLWEMEPSAVEGVGVESPAAEAEYYDLQGRRLAEPAPHGVYIRRQGAKAEKILK
ncbi:MAG: hypothetical protein K2M55_07415 [Muribaculaceae bacterium]|nr:hypothetical protein [Muribaculaceae bacterium]